LRGSEFKWSEKRQPKPPTQWRLLYPQAKYLVVTPKNYQTVVLP